MRGHGQSSPSQDFSFESLVRDAAKVIQRVVNGSEKVVEVFLIGHSLGAAVLAALPGQLKELGNIKFSGLVMVDIIEGKLSCFQFPNNASFVFRDGDKIFKQNADNH